MGDHTCSDPVVARYHVADRPPRLYPGGIVRAQGTEAVTSDGGSSDIIAGPITDHCVEELAKRVDVYGSIDVPQPQGLGCKHCWRVLERAINRVSLGF